MCSKIILQRLGDLLIDYFSDYRKLMCFDATLDDLSKHKHVKQASLIHYPLITGVPLKFYFKSNDIRQKLTKFQQNVIDDKRFEEIIKALERYIIYNVRRINKQRRRKQQSRQNWNKFWWKTSKGFTFANSYLNRFPLKIQDNGMEWNGQNGYRLKLNKNIEKPKNNWPRIKGDLPAIRKTSQPIPVRGEAERITKMAAKLLLITEQEEHDQMKNATKSVKKKPINKFKKFNRQISDSFLQSKYTSARNSIDNPVETSKRQNFLFRNNDDNVQDNTTGTTAFKIKRDLTKESSQPGSLPTLKVMTSRSNQTNSSLTNLEGNLKPPLKSGTNLDSNVGIIFAHSENEDDDYSSETIPKRDSKVIQQKDFKSDLFKKNFKSQSAENVKSQKKSKLSKNKENKQNSNKSPRKTIKSSSNECVAIENGAKSDKSQKKVVKQSFLVKTVTGERLGASTKAAVWLFMIGDRGRLAKSAHLKSSRLHCLPFGRGNTDEFCLRSSVEIGFLNSIQIGHDSSEPGSDWFLEYVDIIDLNMRYQYRFPCHRWLSVRTEDKQTRVSLLPSTPTMVSPSIKMSSKESHEEEEYIQKKTNREVQSAPTKASSSKPTKDAEVQYSPRESNEGPDFEITGGKNRIRIINKQSDKNQSSNIETNRRSTKKKELVIPADDHTWSDLMVEMSQESISDLCSCFTTEFKHVHHSSGAPSLVDTPTVSPIHHRDTRGKVNETPSRSMPLTQATTTTITKYNVQTRNVSHACLSISENMSSRLGNVGTLNIGDNSSTNSQSL